MTTKEQLIETIESQPELTRIGFKGSAEDHKQFKANVSDDDVEHFGECCEWLSKCTVVEKINRDDTSLALKHWVVDGYSSAHGLFIAAAIHMQIPFERCDPSIYLAIGKKQPPPLPKRK